MVGIGAFMIFPLIFVLGLIIVFSNDVDTETVREGSYFETVAVIPLDGVIVSSTADAGFSSNYITDEDFVESLNKSMENSDVKAIIIEVNSPGGEVVASDNMYRAVKKAADRKKKPVYIYISGLAASGSYYVSAGGTKIIAHPSSIIGSIGVISQVMDTDGLYNKLGIKVKTFKTGDFKDSGAFFRKETAKESEKMMMDILNESLELFITSVAEGRHVSKEDVRKIANGKVFSASEAKELKLVDSIGTMDDVVYMISKDLALKNPNIVRYERKKSFWTSLQEKVDMMINSMSPFNQQANLYYLWSVE